jgi:hypothetical protein
MEKKKLVNIGNIGNIDYVPHPLGELKQCLGVRLIKSTSCSKHQFYDEIINRLDKIPLNDVDQPGYLMIYEAGYKSWSPKDDFEKAYRRIDNLTFGLAIEAMKLGKYVARIGWNGKGMYLFLIGTDMTQHGIGGWTYTNGKNDNYPLLPFIAMKTADGKVVPWLASQTDILAEDYMIIDQADPNKPIE